MVHGQFSTAVSFHEIPIKDFESREDKNDEYHAWLNRLIGLIVNEPSCWISDIAVAFLMSFTFQPFEYCIGAIKCKRHISQVEELIVSAVLMNPIDFLSRNLEFTFFSSFRASAFLENKC